MSRVVRRGHRVLTDEIVNVHNPECDHGDELNHKQDDADSHDLERAVIPEIQVHRVRRARCGIARFSSHNIQPQEKSTLHCAHLTQTNYAQQVEIDVAESNAPVALQDHNDIKLICHGDSRSRLRLQKCNLETKRDTKDVL